jgi:hypothetical protein
VRERDRESEREAEREREIERGGGGSQTARASFADIIRAPTASIGDFLEKKLVARSEHDEFK